MHLRRGFYARATAWALMLGLVPASSDAQDSLSFSTVELWGGVSSASLPASLSAYWRGTPGALFSVLTPYGAGALRLTMEASWQRARSPGVPSYLALFPSLEWGLDRPLFGPVRGLASGGIGALWLHFEDVSNPSESELGITATLQLRSALGRGWMVGVGASARRILLADPITQRTAFVQLGFRSSLLPRLRRALADVRREGDTPPIGNSDADGIENGAGSASSEEARDVPRGSRMSLRELRDRGALRLPDVFQAFGWDRVSVDLRAFWATPDALEPPLGLPPYAFIDGVPVPLLGLGGTTLDLLPLALEELEAVQASLGRGRFVGRFLDRSGMHFRTAAPASDGFGAITSALAENATGDPGPLLYTDSSAANVDKVGTGYVVGARWRSGSMSASAGLRFNSDVVTDHNLGGRTLSLRDPNVAYPVIRTHAPWLSARLDLPTGAHDLRIGRTTRSDYQFLPALGFEVPTRAVLTHVGAAGLARGPRGTSWDYSAHATWNELAPSPNDLRLALDLHTRQMGAQAGLTVERAAGRAFAGVGIEGVRATSSLLPSVISAGTRRAWIGGAADVARGEIGVDLELRNTAGEAGSRLNGWGIINVGQNGALRGEVWHIRASPTEQEGFWWLHARGYRFLETADVEVRVGPARERRESGVEVRLEVRPDPSVALTPFTRAIRTDGVPLELPTFQQGARRPEPAAPLVSTTAGPGTVVLVGMEALWKLRESLALEARYRWVHAFSGDPRILEAWGAHPAHRFTHRALWRPRADLRVGVSAEASSASRWIGYEALGKAHLPGLLRLDGWIEKSLWEGRLSLHGRLGDILDRGIALHPLGAAPGLSLMVGASARLGR